MKFKKPKKPFGRPRCGNASRDIMSVRLPTPIINAIEKTAADEETTITHIIECAVVDFLNRKK